MTPRKLFIISLSFLVVVLLGGCSIKPVPYDELLYYEDEYYDEYVYGGYRGNPARDGDHNYRAWQMSQYYRYTNEAGYQPYTEGNANRSSGGYHPNETPVRQAPDQSSQIQRRTQSNRMRQRKDESDRKQTQTTVRDSRSSQIGREQRAKAEKQRRERMKEARKKRIREKDKDEELTEEELEEQRRKIRKKKRHVLERSEG